MAVFPEPDFGPVLLEQKPSRGRIGNSIFIMLLGAPMMAIIAAPNAPPDVRFGFFAFGGGMVVFSLVMLWRNWMHVFLQQRGICEYRQRRRRCLAYDDVEIIIYSSLRIFMNGAYMHTVQKLALGSEETRNRPLVCTNVYKETDHSGVEMATAVTQVRDAIAQRLANEFLLELERGTIPWGPKVRVHRRGIELERTADNWELIEWSRIGRYESDQAVFRIWIDADPSAAIQVKTTVPNFYPVLSIVLPHVSGMTATQSP